MHAMSPSSYKRSDRMTKKEVIFVAGAIAIVVGASTFCYFYKKRQDENVECLKEDVEYLQTKLVKKDNEIELLRTTNTETESAIQTFCEQNVVDMIHELVSTRLTIQKMRNEGASEEDITEKMIRSPTPDLIKTRHITRNLGYAPTEKSNEKSDEEDPEANYEEIFPDPNLPNVHLITEEQFITEDGYEKICITYFGGDDTLCDTDDDILDQNVMEMTDLLTRFANTDCPSIFIRNERRAADYEILWDDDSYQVVVLGVSREKATLLPRIFRRGAGDGSDDQDG